MTQLIKPQNSVGIAKINNATTKEVSIFSASLNLPKIKDYTTKKELAYVNSLITRWAILLGVTLPEPNEINIISNHIKDNHPTFNAVDIEEAINLSVSGKIDTDAEHFGVLSAYYVSKIFKAYQVYKGVVLFKIREELAKKEREKKVIPTEEQCINDFKLLLRNAKEKVLAKEQYYDFGDVLYYFFWTNNLVKRPMPEEFKNKALEYGEKMFKLQAQSMALKDVINGVNFNNTVRKKHIMEHARTYAINEWLKEADIDTIEKKITFKMIYKEIKDK